MLNKSIIKHSEKIDELCDLIKNLPIREQKVNLSVDELSDLHFFMKDYKPKELKKITLKNQYIPQTKKENNCRKSNYSTISKETVEYTYSINSDKDVTDEDIMFLLKPDNPIVEMHDRLIYEYNNIIEEAPYLPDFIEIILKDPSKPIDESFVFGDDYLLRLHIRPSTDLFDTYEEYFPLDDCDEKYDSFTWMEMLGYYGGIDFDKKVDNLYSKGLQHHNSELGGLLIYDIEGSLNNEYTHTFSINPDYHIFDLVIGYGENGIYVKPSGVNTEEVFPNKIKATIYVADKLKNLHTKLVDEAVNYLSDLIDQSKINNDMIKMYFTNRIFFRNNYVEDMFDKIKDDTLLHIIECVSKNEKELNFLKGLYEYEI